MATRMKLDFDHSKIRFAQHEGLYMYECYEPLADHLAKVKAMDIRHDDILLCSFPKSGTHWVYRVLDMLQRRSADYNERNMDSTLVDLQRVELVAELTSPRVLVSHAPFDRLPEQIKDKRTKIVHVYRNPRAIYVSSYFMIKDSVLLQTRNLESVSERMEVIYFSDKKVYHGWCGYMERVSAYELENPDQPIFHVSYEEMTQNPVETVMKLAEFLDKPVTPEFCAQVVEACSFKKQKEEEESQDRSQADMSFYRKGDMNDWKNHLTVALNERINQMVSERATTCPFSAKYTES